MTRNQRSRSAKCAIDSDNVIRHALRGAHYRLALLNICEDSPPDELEASRRRLATEIFDQQGASEDDEVMNCFLEGYAWVLLLLNRRQPSYAGELAEVLAKMTARKLAAQGLVSIELVTAALETFRAGAS